MWHLTTFQKIATCQTSNRQSICLGVSPVISHYTYQVSAMCRTDCIDLPRQSYGCATCYPWSGDMCHTLIDPPVHVHVSIHYNFPCQLYGLYSQLPCQHCTNRTNSTVIIFLLVWKNEQIVISWSYDVRLITFKLC
jgi:hypothetical protein